MPAVSLWHYEVIISSHELFKVRISKSDWTIQCTIQFNFIICHQFILVSHDAQQQYTGSELADQVYNPRFYFLVSESQFYIFQWDGEQPHIWQHLNAFLLTTHVGHWCSTSLDGIWLLFFFNSLRHWVWQLFNLHHKILLALLAFPLEFSGHFAL